MEIVRMVKHKKGKKEKYRRRKRRAYRILAWKKSNEWKKADWQSFSIQKRKGDEEKREKMKTRHERV